jgi:uncharacterized protein (TIGR02266 family)
MPGEETRKFKRLDANWVVKLRATQHAELQEHRIKNISLGGVFIETTMPLEIGNYIELTFKVPGYSETVCAKGVIRWSNDGRMAGQPVGMGIEFLEVASVAQQAIEGYISSHTRYDVLKPILRSKLHRNFLRLYCGEIGKRFSVDTLMQELECKSAQLLEVVLDFTSFKLVRFSESTVTFLVAETPELAELLKDWYQSV